jgi:translation initiation factor IF-3
VRINDRIRVREVRVIDENGQQLGIMAPAQAVAIARQRGLDLVEVSPTAVPPVCRITDYGKYQYTEQKRARQARKHQKTILVKEIKFRPKVDEHDYDFKKKHIERFIEDGDKVKAVIFFRGREIAHPEIGRRILERLINEVSEIAVAENMPRMEGNSMHVILGPRPGTGVKKPSPPPPQAQQRRAPEPVQAASAPAPPSAASAGTPAAAEDKS